MDVKTISTLNREFCAGSTKRASSKQQYTYQQMGAYLINQALAQGATDAWMSVPDVATWITTFLAGAIGTIVIPPLLAAIIIVTAVVATLFLIAHIVQKLWINSQPQAMTQAIISQAVNDLDNPNRKSHILQSKHQWNNLFPDPNNNWEDIKKIIKIVLTYGTIINNYNDPDQVSYFYNYAGYYVYVVGKWVEGAYMIGDAWVSSVIGPI